MQPPARCSNHRCVYIDQCVCTVFDEIMDCTGFSKFTGGLSNNQASGFIGYLEARRLILDCYYNFLTFGIRFFSRLLRQITWLNKGLHFRFIFF